MHVAIECQKHMMKQWIDLKGEIDKFASIVGDISMPLSIKDRTSSKKTNKTIDNLKDTINQ